MVFTTTSSYLQQQELCNSWVDESADINFEQIFASWCGGVFVDAEPKRNEGFLELTAHGDLNTLCVVQVEEHAKELVISALGDTHFSVFLSNCVNHAGDYCRIITSPHVLSLF